MPGLVGIITKMPHDRAVVELHRMVDALRHESFYAAGTWIERSLGLYVGWVARRGSFSDGMPLRNEKRDLVLAFSGEEFPDSGCVVRLKEKGHTVDAGVSSYLVHVAEEDKYFPKSLNGRFHGLLADLVKRTITLFNDRYGMHRIYYHEAKDAFYFAAEAKAILAVRRELRAVDSRGLSEFISCGCALENRTIFKDIHVLPPSSSWFFRETMIEKRNSYFDPKEWEDQNLLDYETYYQQLREVFARNLPRYFSGPEGIGISLTGGLDSRIILSWHKPTAGSLPCYSFGGMFRDCQDVVMARAIAGACKQKHEVISVGNDFLLKYPYYSERAVYLTDGCVEVKHAPDLYVNERTLKIAPVRMTGNYGGEVLRRVRAFKPVDPIPGLFQFDLADDVQCAKDTYHRLEQRHPLSFAVFCQAPWHHQSLLCLEQSQLSIRSPYLDNDLVQIVYRAPQSALTSNDISLRLIEDGDRALRQIRTDRGLGGHLPRPIAALQQKYLEFTFKAEYAYDYGMPQSVARVDHALSRLHLERLFLGRHKFYHFRIWYRDALANYIREMLLDSRTLSRSYLQRSTLESVVNGHLKGNRNYTSAIHKILSLEHLHRLFIDT